MTRLLAFSIQLAALAGLLTTGGCKLARSEAAKTTEQNTAATPPPLTIQVARPVWRTVQRTAQGQGALFAKESVILSNKMAGYVNRELVDFGDKVKAGQVLAESNRHRPPLSGRRANMNVHNNSLPNRLFPRSGATRLRQSTKSQRLVCVPPRRP